MDDNERNFSITAFLVGGILGASASLLFTSESGKDLRTNIKNQRDKYLKSVKTKADDLVRNSKTTGELLKRKAGDLMDTVKQYAAGKIDKPHSIIEKEIAALKAAITAAKASYAISPETDREVSEPENSSSIISEFNDETLPKHIGMGKGRNRNSYYS